jgi:hypothetical protein
MSKPLILLATLIAAVAVSCRAEVNLGLDLEADASGTMLAEIGTDQEFRDFMGSFGADIDTLFGDLEDTAGGEATLVERQEGGLDFTGVEIAFDDVNQLADELGGATADFGVFDDFSFESDGSQAVFDATVSAPEQDLLAGSDFDPSQLSGDYLNAYFTLKMPGSVTSTNADDTLPDGRLRWQLPIFGGTLNVHAESDLGGAGFPWLWLVVGLIVVVGVIVVIAIIVAGRRQQRRAVADAAAAYQRPPVEPSPDED